MNGEVTFTIPPNPITDSTYGGSSAVHLGYQATLTEKGVILTSTLEPSYYKGELRSDVSKNSPVARQHPHKRKDDGSMEADTVATYQPNYVLFTRPVGYYGSATLEARLYGMPYMSNMGEWTLQGGGSLVDQPTAPWKRVYEFLGKSKSDMPFSSSVKFKYTDPSGGKELKANYSIKWHRPAENGEKLTGKPGFPAEVLASQNLSLHAIAKDQNGNLKPVPVANDMFTFKVKGYTEEVLYGGDIFVAGLSLVASASGLIAPDGSKVPDALATFADLMGLAWTIGKPGEPWEETERASFAYFKEAVDNQKRINSREVTGLDLAYRSYIRPSYVVRFINDSNIREYFEGKYGTFRVENAAKYSHQLRDKWKGDGYDGHGYSGDVYWSHVRGENTFFSFGFIQ